jgi:Flp pilus assembly protein TadG
MVELAIVMPVVLIVLIGVVQFALVYHAENVAATAAQEGARFAAAEDRTAAEGADRAREVLQSGLGKKGTEFSVSAEEGEESVVVRAEGEYALIIPWVTGNTVPIAASAEVRKEAFRSGP